MLSNLFVKFCAGYQNILKHDIKLITFNLVAKDTVLSYNQKNIEMILCFANTKLINNFERIIMRKKLFATLSVSLFLILINVSGNQLSVDAVTLQTIAPKDINFTGKVEAFESVLLAFNVPGIIKTTLPLGTQVYSTVTGENGKVIRDGTIVASLYKNQQEYAVKAAHIAVKIAESNYEKAIIDYKRQKELIAKKAVSMQSYQDSSNALLNANLNLETAKNAFITAKYNLDCCEITSPFDGIISEIIRGSNRSCGQGDDVLQVTRLNPIMIKVEFPSIIRAIISKSTVVKIYSNRMINPMPSWYEPNPRDSLNAEFFVGNVVIPTNIEPNEKKIPKVYEVLPVTDMSLIPNPDLKESKLAVPVEAIKKDKDGQHYVFRAKGQRALSLKKGIAKVFTIEKINVTPGKIGTQLDLGFKGQVKLCNLENNGDLKFHDVLVVKSEDNLKDGGKALLVEQHYMFQPGEIVAVQIPSLNMSGFYVHHKSIILMGKSRNFVYINDKGKAKLITVKVTGTTGRYYKIESPEIKDGTQVLVFNKLSTLRKCYDGAPIKINKLRQPPVHLEHPHATALYFPKQPIEEIYHL